MAIGGGRISLPLAVGVDCGHPRSLGVDHGHPQWPDLFSFFWLVHRRQIWPLRVAGSLPLAVGVDRGHPQWPDLSSSSSFFFFFLKKKKVAGKFAGGGRRMAVGGGICRRRWAAGDSRWRRPSPEVGGELFIWLLNLLIWCFDFIFSWCIFLKLLRCQ
jgi:hypothetical protein